MHGNGVCHALVTEDVPGMMNAEKRNIFHLGIEDVCLFLALLYVPINSYGHCGMVISPNHTFSRTSLKKRLTNTSCTYFRLYLTITLLECFSSREENDRRNYFMINLHECMGPDGDRNRNPWICSRTRICSQTALRGTVY